MRSKLKMEKTRATDRRTSTHSESSVEPMDTSDKFNATGNTATNQRSMHNESDEYESDMDDNSFLRRDNLTQHNSTSQGTTTKVVTNNIPTNNNINNNNNNNSTKVTRKKFRMTSNLRNNNTLQYHHNNNINNHHHHHHLHNNHRTDKAQDLSQTDSSGFVDTSENNINSSIESSINREDVKYTCPICDQILITQHDFTEHIRGHNNSDGSSDNFTCRVCSKVLSSSSSLDRHVLVHTGERPFTCTYCHVTFTTNGNMHRHMRTHKKRGDGECYESDGSTDSTGSTGSHVKYNSTRMDIKRKSNDDDGGCIKRRLKTINNNNIISDRSSPPESDTSAGQKFCCPVCYRNDFISMVLLETHLDNAHPNILAKCRHCEVVFKSHKTLNAHKCGVTQKGPPQMITQGFKDINFVDFTSEKFPLIAKSMCEKSLRMAITSQKFECPKCMRAFPCASAVDIHVKSCGATERAQDFTVRKRHTSETSDEDVRRDDFFAHLDLQNKSMVTPNAANSDTMSSPRFSERSHGGYQYKQEPEDDSSTYRHMGDSTKDLADIQSILNVTSSGGSFMHQLDKSLPPMQTRDIYGREEEEAQDVFTAEFRKMKLRGEFPCKLCTAVFPNLRALKGHNRIHLSSAGAGPYQCNMCPFQIHDKAALIRHMRTHNGDRPYECAICNYAFTTKANCERHLRNRHGKSTRDEVKRAIIYHPSEDSSCDDPSKKLQLFSSPDFESEDDHVPKDRSTPVSHLNEISLPSENNISAKIQVKSLDKLIQPSMHSDDELDENDDCKSDDGHRGDSKPMDLSMDALDLSKKQPSTVPDPKDENDESDRDIDGKTSDIFDKNQQLLMAQQQFLHEALPKMDPAQYFQFSQLYRNLVFPPTGFPLHPFFLPNPFLPQQQLPTTSSSNDGVTNEMKEMMVKDLARSTQPLFSMGGPLFNPPTPSPISATTQNMATPSIKTSPQKSATPPHSEAIPRQATPQSQMMSNTGGPVKMVIKNGVLMPKQKQRRYRTERPFACEHCSARFTLRSNMERHIKQQHPQFWAQRQRSGHGLLRRGHGGQSGGSSGNTHHHSSSSAIPATIPSTGFSSISNQVKFAILAQQFKCNKKSSEMFGSAPNENISSTSPSCVGVGSNLNSSNQSFNDEHNNNNEDEDEEMPPSPNTKDDEDEPQLVIDEDFQPEDLSSKITAQEPVNMAAKQIAENILEQAKKAQTIVNPRKSMDSKDFDVKIASNLIARTDVPEGDKFTPSKDVSNSPQLKEEQDLASVSKLVDNARTVMSFGNYFPAADSQQMEHSDEEGLVASGSASESNNSGTDDPPPGLLEKKKSAYSLAPNRVSCPYCQRMFPWSSSLRRHILTHTGQKPFKCSHCPLLFTTKSNCDRHLLRKHGNVESAMSLYVPVEDLPEPKTEAPPVPAVAVPMQTTEPSSEPPTQKSVSSSVNATTINIPQVKSANATATIAAETSSASASTTSGNVASTDLPFKCHLCDSSFSDRGFCLDHIETVHIDEFALLIKKGAIETLSDPQIASAEDDDCKAPTESGRGKYPDYANRKVICAFCLRRFWSTEDLRRHMRTHSGERPFMCNICLRKFTLKHSMLRHRKNHGHNNNDQQTTNSGSDSEDEQPTYSSVSSMASKLMRIQETLQKEMMAQRTASAAGCDVGIPSKETISTNAAALALFHHFQQQQLENKDGEDGSDLIGNLLGISDQGILNKVLLSSADEAAKLLGVDK